MSNTAETRKYHIKHVENGRVVRERIIEATNRSTARAHASNTTIGVQLLSADHALRLGAAGVKTEQACASRASNVDGVEPDQQDLPLTDPDGGAAPQGEQDAE